MVRDIKNILISQNIPAEKEKSQYDTLAKKFNLNFTFNKFFEVVRISPQDYRKQRINLLDYPAVIMTSTMAVDNYFYFAEHERLKIPDDMKFFCITDSIANYLQNYIQYRKRKIFYGKGTFDDLITVIQKHKEDKYLFPCAEDGLQTNFKKLEMAKMNYTPIVMHRSVPKDLSKINIKKYDMVVMFAPIGVKSFIQNFPDVTSNDLVFAAFGKSTQLALQKSKIKVSVLAPTTKAPSMIMALTRFFEERKEETKQSTTSIAKATASTTKATASTAKTTATASAEPKETAKKEVKTVKKTTTTKKTTTKTTKTTTTKKTSTAAKKTEE